MPVSDSTSSPLDAASLGIALTLAITGLAFIFCGLAIRDAGYARVVPRAPYARDGATPGLNRWIGNRLVALGCVALGAATAAVFWSIAALPLLGVFAVAGSYMSGLIVAGPNAAATGAEDTQRPSPREPASPGTWLADGESRRAGLG